MRGVPGWFDVASMCRLQTYNLSQKQLNMVMGSMIMKRQCHLPPSEFCGKGQWRCHESAVNSLTEACFVHVLYLCLITDYDIVRLFSTLKRG